MKELKPCPFCGSEAKLMRYNMELLNRKLLIEEFAVKCTKCGASTVKYESVTKYHQDGGDKQIICDGMQEAIDAWNQRSYDE